MDAFDRIADGVATWLLIFIGFGIAIVLGLMVAVIYYLLLLLMYYHQYQRFYRLAGETVDEEFQLHGDNAAQGIAQSLWGVGVAVPQQATEEAVFGTWVAGS
jgi:hypothetical protein